MRGRLRRESADVRGGDANERRMRQKNIEHDASYTTVNVAAPVNVMNIG